MFSRHISGVLFPLTMRPGHLTKLERNDMMMVQWMYMTLKDRKSFVEFRDHLGLVEHMKVACKGGRLRLFGHFEIMDKDSWVKKYSVIIVGL